MNIPEINISHVPYLLDRDGGRSATPARCNRVTGDIFINDEVWRKIKPTHRLFILLHECGHIAHRTSNEQLADQFAFDHFIKMGYPLTQSVQALSSVLPGKDSHVQRVRTQLQRALQVDTNNKKMSYYANSAPWFAANTNYDSYDDLFGMVKNWKKNQEIRRKKKEAKVEIKLAKADAIRSKGEAKKTLAEQGIGGGQGFTKVLETAQALLQPAQPVVTDMPSSGGGPGVVAAASNTKKILIWVGVGLAVLTVAIVGFKMLRK